MYSKDKLTNYIKIAIDRNAGNHVVVELLGELEQIPVTFPKDEINVDELHNYVGEDELFVNNANYQSEAKDFDIYNNDGKLLLTIEPDRVIHGKGFLRFTIPIENSEDFDAFVEFCDRLQNNNAVKYPKPLED